MKGFNSMKIPHQQVQDYSNKKKSINPLFNWIGGILFTFIIAVIGISAAKLPLIEKLGPMVTAILIAMIYRQVAGYPEAVRSGVQFAGKKILRMAIILFGFKLNVEIILHQGLGLLARDAITIILAMAVTLLIARWLKADFSLSLLLAVGTGVCGAAAIAAVSPIVKAKDDETAIGVGIIALMGTIFTILYTILRPILQLSDLQYGIWSGISLHEIAHVAAAAAPAGQDAVAVALLAKLGRVLLLIPLCFILAAWMKKKNATDGQVKVEFPWFLIGFIVTSLIGTYVPIPKAFMQDLATLSSFLLTAAMVGLGLNVSLQALRTKAFKPLISMTIASIVLSIFTFFLVILF
ncbi:MAG TPA: putative sulfate exporter family transporter [Bacillota bacterium]|nr:putative sulfate exporter family transporter [Bacillota bacterium]